ncbi:MAG TPA: hypothetical protein VJB90_02685 [Candidatus Nanoarchaeia archaeon]|nr:hypothetical protein [Candidatus Nanoarchaeia archaeon]
MEEHMTRPETLSSRYFSDFNVGDHLYHGKIEIRPIVNSNYIRMFGDNNQLAANLALAEHLRLVNPELLRTQALYSATSSGMVNQVLLFNMVFGQTVQDVSFHGFANLFYRDWRFGAPVFVGDTIESSSGVLATGVQRDGASSGSVTVRTTAYNQRGEMVLTYIRSVLVRGKPGESYAQKNPEVEPPKDIDWESAVIPLTYNHLDPSLLGSDGKTFEEFSAGVKYKGTFESSIPLEHSVWLQTATQNGSLVHASPNAGFIVYGGSVIATAMAQISGLMPLAYIVGVKQGTHENPTYPGDIVQLLYPNEEGEHEQIRTAIEVLGVNWQLEDIGVLTAKLTAEKKVTGAGREMLQKYAKGSLEKIMQYSDGEFLPVLGLEMVLALPKRAAFE